jgi:exopolysaccharide biosynthesis polyprenyl glycosylphosphotransferase
MLLTGNTHCIAIARRALRDVGLLALCFLVAHYVRFQGFFHLDRYGFSVGAGALALVVVSYIFGLYSVEARGRSRFFIHGLMLSAAFLAAVIMITFIGYVDFSSRIGRGFMALGVSMAYPALLIHHWAMFNKHRFAPERVVFLAESLTEMAEYERIKELKPRGIEIVGRIDISGATPGGDLLGRIKHIRKLTSRHKVDRVVFPDARLDDAQARPYLRQLRYSGMACTPLISLCEEYLQYVPLHLVSTEWLMHSESSPRELYFRKLKRTFDILTSLALLALLSPALLIGICIVKFFSPEGPLFFRQERVGRFGKSFEIFKLRSMRTDAEKNGPQWSTATSDPRVFPGGAFLRRYRIDEIPQLINILRGDMSFVGPRPEQPAFVQQLAQVLPFYEERHMIHPGLTGWAQVCYPYGATTEDAHCKLEYDLYYLKHAGVVFDLLILLDTVRVVLIGGMKKAAQKPRYRPSPATEALNAAPAMMKIKDTEAIA